jgi:hypothetical protein
MYTIRTDDYLGYAITEWHTHVLRRSTWGYFSDADVTRSNRFGLHSVVINPNGQIVYRSGSRPTPGTATTPHEPYYFTTYEDYLIDHRNGRFGPLSTIQLIAYLLHCVVGEVDICAGTGPGIGIAVDPRTVPETGGTDD